MHTYLYRFVNIVTTRIELEVWLPNVVSQKLSAATLHTVISHSLVKSKAYSVCFFG